MRSYESAPNNIEADQSSNSVNETYVVRVIEFDRIKSYKVQEILQDASSLYQLQQCNKNLIGIVGIHFLEREQSLHVYLPERVSLFYLIHQSSQTLTSAHKHQISLKLTKSLLQIHFLHHRQSQNHAGQSTVAHAHLTSKNVFVDLSKKGLKIQIGDYGMQTLKKFCKIFKQYSMLSKWSAPEIWSTQFSG